MLGSERKNLYAIMLHPELCVLCSRLLPRGFDETGRQPEAPEEQCWDPERRQAEERVQEDPHRHRQERPLLLAVGCTASLAVGGSHHTWRAGGQ